MQEELLRVARDLVAPGPAGTAALSDQWTGSDELFDLSESETANSVGALNTLLRERTDNPDASRHFCTRARELLSSFLALVAPDAEVLPADPDCPLAPNGSDSRRARVRHCLIRQGTHDRNLVELAEVDLDNVMRRFDEFNSGTHGEAGRFDLVALTAIKQRVEGAIQSALSGAQIDDN